MKLTKDIIPRELALRVAPEYVAFAERTGENFDTIINSFEQLKRGDIVITALENEGEMVYVRAKVSSVNHKDIRAVDGPIVRVGNSEYTWRCDGSKYAYPVKF